MEDLKTTPLFEKEYHSSVVLGEYFAVWRLPKYYSDVETEYRAAREAAALMDRSYLGLLKVTGKDHADLLHRLTANELRTLQTGEGQINLFTNEKGRLIDRVILYKFADEMWLLPSPQTPETIADWIQKYTFLEDVKVEKLCRSKGVLSLFGSRSAALLSDLFEEDFESLPDHHFRLIESNLGTCVIARTEELGIPGFNLIAETTYLPELWIELVNHGATPMGQEAYEVVRIEAGWPLYAKDYSEANNPHEPNFTPYLSFTKGCFIGQEVVARLDTYEKVQKHLMGIVIEGETTPRSGDTLVISDQEVGYVTSATFSFALRKIIAMAYVRTKFIRDNAQVILKSGERRIAGTLVKLPFVKG